MAEPSCSNNPLPAVFDYLQRLHFGVCTPQTAVVVHSWAHAGLGNALGQLLLSLQFAALHNRVLVISTASESDSWVWLNNSGFHPHDLIWPSSCDLLAREMGSHRIFTHRLQMNNIFCPTYGCPWANAVPEPFSNLCVMNWYSHLLDFILRPSKGMHDWLAEYAAPPVCGPELCGANGEADSNGHDQLARVTRRERSMMRAANSSSRGSWRPPFALELASRLRLPVGLRKRDLLVVGVHLRVGDACVKARPQWQRPACVYTEGDGWASGWAERISGWISTRRQSDVLGARRPRDVAILLSTDSARAYDKRAEEVGERLGASTVVGFNFPRTKYDHDEESNGNDANNKTKRGVRLFLEERLRSKKQAARPLLAEALLDLLLLSHSTHLLVGSMYSNFARLALQLGHMVSGGMLRHESFDAFWCPYHQCQAGCMDLQRICSAPRLLAEAELSAGPRGSYEVGGGQRPRRLQNLFGEALINATHPARRPWAACMLKLAERTSRKNDDKSRRNDTRACLEAFEEAREGLEAMPRLY